MRAAALALALGAMAGAAAACGPAPEARFFGPVDRYGHKVLGDTPEWSGLRVGEQTIVLPDDRIFEDLVPRLADFDGDCVSEIVVVESGATDGAQLAIYAQRHDGLHKIAATPPIGRAFRWLSPAGIGDFNNDGALDVALVRMPHILGALEVWTFAPGGLTRLAAAKGFTNHRIGDVFITGGVRNCGEGDEMVLPDFRWDRLYAVRVRDGMAERTPIADATDWGAVSDALRCE